jgi:hypothetical protein
MTRSPALVRVGLKSGRWLQPWVVVAFVSVGIAYAMSNAIGGSSASYQQPDVQIAVSPGEATGATAFERSTTPPAATSAGASRSPIPDRCVANGGGPMHVGVDWWIVAESQRITCEPGAR